MPDAFFKQPILNSPYECPRRHWELDPSGQPTTNIVDQRRRAKFITPIPKPRKQRGKAVAVAAQSEIVFGDEVGLSTADQQYDVEGGINAIRAKVDAWRLLPNPAHWQVTPEKQKNGGVCNVKSVISSFILP